MTLGDQESLMNLTGPRWAALSATRRTGSPAWSGKIFTFYLFYQMVYYGALGNGQTDFG